MTEAQKKQLERAITQLEARIDTYERAKERARKQALYDGECGYHESAQFNKGQQFALDYVVEDLQIVLEGLKAIN